MLSEIYHILEHNKTCFASNKHFGQLLGIIDCYEALTNEDRPYRRARQPLVTLKLLKNDVQAGKFSRDIFEKFCYSLI